MTYPRFSAWRRSPRVAVLSLLAAAVLSAPVFALDAAQPTSFQRQIGAQLPVRLDATGITVSEAPGSSQGEWSLSLAITELGRRSARVAQGQVVPVLHAGRVEYHRQAGLAGGAALVEWWQPVGSALQQGFHLPLKPGGPPNQALEFRIDLRGDARPVVAADGRGVVFVDPASGALLSYSGLLAWDATGKSLPAWIEPVPGARAFRLLVDDRRARYPLTIDPLLTNQVAALDASDGTSGDQFGQAVALSGQTLAVGAPMAENGGSNRGAVYIHEQDLGGPENWGERIKISDPQVADNRRFGTALALENDLLVVGVPRDGQLGTNAGAAYVHLKDQGGVDNWGNLLKLLGLGTDANDVFGTAIAISGDVVAIGAPKAGPGKVFLHGRNTGGANAFGLVKVVVGAGLGSGDRFGETLVLEGDTLVVSAMGDDDEASNAGALYVFEKDLGGVDNWGERTKLTIPGSNSGDELGTSLALSGDTLAAGAPRSDFSFTSSGRVYLFERDHTGADQWGLFRIFEGRDPAASDEFGASVGLVGDSLMVGVTGKDEFANNGGAVEIYSRDHGGTDNWGYAARTAAVTMANGDDFGARLALEGLVGAVGAPLANPNGNNSGSVTIFTVDVGSPPPAGTQSIVLVSDANATLNLAATANTRRVVWVDLNNDGFQDLLELNYLGPDGNLAHVNDGAGAFVTSSMTSSPTNALLGIDTDVIPDGIPNALSAKAVAFGDWDNDGDQDGYLGCGPIVTGNQLRNWFVKNQTINGIDPPAPAQFTVHDPGNGIDAHLDHTYDARFGDFNLDGFTDLVVVNRLQPKRLYFNEGSSVLGQFRPVTDAGSSPVPAVSALNPVNPLVDPLDDAGSRAVEVGDLDGDGDLDIFIANGGVAPEVNQVFVNQGGNQAGVPGNMAVLAADVSVTELFTSYGLDLGDLDNDGDLDAFICNRNEVNNLLRNDTLPGGNPTFTRILGTAVDDNESGFLGDPPVYGDSYDCAIADLDADGDTDIMVVNREQKNFLYLATSAAPTLLDNPATAYVRLSGGNDVGDRGNSRSVAVADIDIFGPLARTGVPEIALGKSGGTQNQYYQNFGKHVEDLGGRTVLGDFDPVLWADGTLSATTDLTLKVESGQANSAGFMVVGFSSVPTPFNGGVLSPVTDIVDPILTDISGDVDYTVLATSLPPNPEGLPFWFQAQIADVGMTGQPNGAFSITNCLVVIVE